MKAIKPARAWRILNKEEAWCARCQEYHPIEEFAQAGDSGIQGYCQEAQKDYFNEWRKARLSGEPGEFKPAKLKRIQEDKVKCPRCIRHGRSGWRPLAEFSASLPAYCRRCVTEDRAERRSRLKLQISDSTEGRAPAT